MGVLNRYVNRTLSHSNRNRQGPHSLGHSLRTGDLLIPLPVQLGASSAQAAAGGTVSKQLTLPLHLLLPPWRPPLWPCAGTRHGLLALAGGSLPPGEWVLEQNTCHPSAECPRRTGTSFPGHHGRFRRHWESGGPTSSPRQTPDMPALRLRGCTSLMTPLGLLTVDEKPLRPFFQAELLFLPLSLHFCNGLIRWWEALGGQCLPRAPVPTHHVQGPWIQPPGG